MTTGILNLDACIPMYHEALRFISFALKKNGDEVVHLGCDAALQRCVNINSQSDFLKSSDIDALKTSLCTKCRAQQLGIKRQRRFAVSPELDKLTPRQESLFKEISTNLDRDPRGASIANITCNNVANCRIAFYDFSIALKVTDQSVLNEEEVRRLKQHIHDALLLQNFFERIGRECRFDAIYYVNGNYSHNTLARSALKNSCREFYSLEFQFSSYKIWNRIFFERDRLAVGPKWPTIKSLEASYKLTKTDLRSALQVMENRFLGKDFNSYTKPGSRSNNSIFDDFRKKYSTIVTYFSCSTDELYCHMVTHGTEIDGTFYQDQYGLLDDLFRHAKPDIGYVIRVHPRLAPNKRDRQMSREVEQIKQYLDSARKKENFLVIEANDPISSYYVMLKSDLVVVAWSTIALEALVAGKPAIVLFPSNCMFPISELSRQPADLAEYRQAISGTISFSRFKIDEVRLMRWISMTYSAMAQPIPSPRGGQRTMFALMCNVFYHAVVARRWAYDFFVAPLSLFSSNAVDGMLLKKRLFYRPSADQDDIDGGLMELSRFRRKIRAIERNDQA